MGGGSSSSQQATSESRSAPWETQQPYLEDIFRRAEDLYSGRQLQYGPDRVAQESGYSGMGRQALGGIAAAGSPGYMDAARSNMEATIRGDYLTPDKNPFLSQVYDTAAGAVSRNFQESVMPTLNTRFAAAGRTQGDAGANAQTAAQGRAQGELARELGGMAANIYGQNYSQERAAQRAAANFAPQMASEEQRMGLQRADALMRAGDSEYATSQRELDDVISRFQFNQDIDARKLAEFASFIGRPITESQSSGQSSGSSSSVKVF